MARCADLACRRDGNRLTIPGLVLVRQRPGSAKGVLFLTLEDETGFANITVWPDLFAAQRRMILAASLLACHGRLLREGAVIHVIAQKLEDLSGLLRGVGRMAGVPGEDGAGAEAEDVALLVRGRDFK